MKRSQLIEQLEYVDSHMNHYQNKLIQEKPYYYTLFGTEGKWEHDKDIWRKCLAFWRRKNNRILKELEIKI